MGVIFTAFNITCGKVMFSQLSVSYSVHRGRYLWSRSPLGGGIGQVPFGE